MNSWGDPQWDSGPAQPWNEQQWDGGPAQPWAEPQWDGASQPAYAPMRQGFAQTPGGPHWSELPSEDGLFIGATEVQWAKLQQEGATSLRTMLEHISA
eukprot:6659150-Prymnesium_polylepis.2